MMTIVMMMKRWNYDNDIDEDDGEEDGKEEIIEYKRRWWEAIWMDN